MDTDRGGRAGEVTPRKGGEGRSIRALNDAATGAASGALREESGTC